MDPLFLTNTDVLKIHDEQIQFYGGSAGLRDAGLLDSAIATPMATFDGQYLHEGLYEMAGAYLFHLTQNHPFIDANKRTGANAAMTFLYINGLKLTCSQDELVNTTLAVASGVLGKKDLAIFFEKNTCPVLST